MEFDIRAEIDRLHLRFAAREILLAHRKRYDDHDLLHQFLLSVWVRTAIPSAGGG
ncbi:Uncharacterised protein [Mycobacterium tuberculosis]|nr:Uncharacterised protein [Mycobacterium tuberculosis]